VEEAEAHSGGQKTLILFLVAWEDGCCLDRERGEGRRGREASPEDGKRKVQRVRRKEKGAISCRSAIVHDPGREGSRNHSWNKEDPLGIAEPLQPFYGGLS